MQQQEAVELITNAFRQFLGPGNEAVAVDENTRLVGGKTLLDSAALVSLIVEVEQQVEDRYDVTITIADDRAISQETSPFRTVKSLAEYVVKLYEENTGAPRV